jgi:acetoin utilization protein AcuB
MEQSCPACGARLPEGVPARLKDLTVKDVMTRDPVTLGPEDSLMRAFEVLRLHHIRRLPIVAGGRLVGIVVAGDLKRAQPSILTTGEEEFNRVLEGTQIGRIMINEPVTLDESASLAEAVQLLLTTKFGALPVLREGRLVGILTDNDLHRTLADLLNRAG